MDSIVTVYDNPIQIIRCVHNTIDTCVYCLDGDGTIITNNMCKCKYVYHQSCQEKNIQNNIFKCPLCRKIFQIGHVQHPIIINIQNSISENRMFIINAAITIFIIMIIMSPVIVYVYTK